VTLAVSVMTVVLLVTPLAPVSHRVISLSFVNGNSWMQGVQNTTSTSAVWGRAVDDGHWYNFSRPPLFVFYVYSAFLVDHRPQDEIRLISITSPTELFIRRRLDIFCVVRYSDRRKPHVASILQRPPRRISEPGSVRGHAVGNYVYSCPLPSRRQAPVSAR